MLILEPNHILISSPVAITSTAKGSESVKSSGLYGMGSIRTSIFLLRKLASVLVIQWQLSSMAMTYWN